METKPKTVGIIGAGISGMVAAKELKELGVEYEVFEMMPMIGGAFAHYGWKNGKLTSSTAFTWFSDFPMQDRQRHLPWPEWLEYLESYCAHFKTKDKFNFNCKVLSVTKVPEGGWTFRIHRKNWSNGAWQHPENIDVEEEIFERHFDVLVAGSGLHNKPYVPAFMGAEEYKAAGGQLIHSADFQSASDFAGKRVCVVGAGESASDIAWLCSKEASQVAISMRSPPGTMFPHTINGWTADIRDNRLIYSWPRWTSKIIRRAHKRFYDAAAEHPDEKCRGDAFKWAAKSNYDNTQTIFTINACKSFGIPKAVTFNGATTHRSIKMIEGRTVHFADGTTFENCDAIIASTGYHLEIPAMGAEFSDFFKKPRGLWKNMVSPDVEDFFLMGFCRPHQINLITCCEMQARAMAQVVSGRKKLPPKEDMLADVEKFKTHMGTYFERGGPALVDFIPFIDGLAEFIGCAPNMVYWMLRDPFMFFNMVYGPLQPCQYRLSGPGACPDKARATIMATPYFKGTHNLSREGRRREIKVTVASLSWSMLSVLGFKQYALVGQLRQPFELIAAMIMLLFAYVMYSVFAG